MTFTYLCECLFQFLSYVVCVVCVVCVVWGVGVCVCVCVCGCGCGCGCVGGDVNECWCACVLHALVTCVIWACSNIILW